MRGTIIRMDGIASTVESDGSTYRCHLRRRLSDTAIEEKKALAVGDEVEFARTGRDEGVIEKVYERRSKLSRTAPFSPQREHVIVSNVDKMIIVASIVDPRIRIGLIDRYLIAGSIEKLTPVICINKIDLASEKDYMPVVDVYENIGCRVIAASAITGAGLMALKGELRGCKSVVVGQSGVGKSSLLNRVEPGLELRIGPMAASRKGSHTTSWVSLLRLSFGGYVIDTPGIREFSIWDMHPKDVAMFFDEIWECSADCRMSDCTHTHEPDCAVKRAVADEKIARVRYDSYCRLLGSIDIPEEPLDTDVERPGEQISRKKRRPSRGREKQLWRKRIAEDEDDEEQ